MAFREKLNEMPVTRRGLLVGAAAGGGLFIAWSLWPRSYDPPLLPREGEFGFGAWITIAPDGVVSVAVPQLEMGQGVLTLLPQIVATELGADWRQIAVESAPPSGAQPNIALAARWAPLWSSFPSLADEPDTWLAERYARSNAFTATADGMTLPAYEMPCREAAASARAMLAMAAATRWNVRWEECETTAGFVLHGKKRARFGDLADEAAQMTPPETPPLRPRSAHEPPIPGETEVRTGFPRIDLPAKVDGSFLFAGDVRLPGMGFASVRHGPLGKPELADFNPGATAGIPGIMGVVRSKRWLAAVARDWWHAERALDAMAPQFAGPGGISSEAVFTALDEGLKDGEGERIAAIGDPDSLFESEAEPAPIVRRYEIAPAAHAAIETASATARIADGRLELWIASQAPERTREAAAKAAGFALHNTVLYPMAAGGSFDARLEKQHAIEVVQIAQEIGHPVQLTWSRGEEMKAVPPRTPIAALMSARLAPTEPRAPLAWRAQLAMPATAREFGHRLFDNLVPEAAIAKASGEADPLACEGAVPPYAIANVAVDHIPVEINLPTGRLRGNAPAYTAFLTECFLDELAHEARQDPLLYRIALLGGQKRMAEVLQHAARLGKWGGGHGGSGQGIAMVRMTRGAAEFECSGFIACVAEAQAAEGGIAVRKLSAVADIGRIVNLDIARQQIEGGLVFGASLAMGSALRYARGLPRPVHLGGLALPSLADCPEIVLDLIASEAPPFDPGELGVAVAAPAIGNALYSATGERIRRLPLREGRS